LKKLGNAFEDTSYSRDSSKGEEEEVPYFQVILSSWTRKEYAIYIGYIFGISLLTF
jgi:hypothetical protein